MYHNQIYLILIILIFISYISSYIITSPTNINGIYRHSTSSFSYMPGYYNYINNINIIIGNPINGCKKLDIPNNYNSLSIYNNNVILLMRGECYFYDKVINAVNAGAVGVLIGNIDDTIFTMNAQSNDNSLNYVDIPAMMIPNSDFQLLYNISLHNSTDLIIKLTTIGEDYTAMKTYIDNQLNSYSNEYTWIYWLLPAILFILVQVYIYYRCVQSNWWQQIVARWTLRNHAANNPQVANPPLAPENNNVQDADGYQALSNNNRNV